MRRREFIAIFSSALVAWPFVGRAQQPTMPVVGFLGGGSPDTDASRVRALRQGLSELGYVEGRNVTIEYRWAEGQFDRFPILAADLVRHRVDAIVALGGTPSALAAKAATTSIPIVFEVAVDPVEFGLVTSLSRPGGNLTGSTILAGELGRKLFEVAHELVPTATTMGLLVNPTNPAAATQSRDAEAAARTLALKLYVLEASAERDFDAVFAALAQRRTGALVIGPDVLFTNRSDQLAALMLRHSLPAIYSTREFAMGGGLMGYGPSIREAWHLSGVYVGRILKGENPADLPVQQVTKVELVINLKSAKALGIDVPLSLLARADEVIE